MLPMQWLSGWEEGGLKSNKETYPETYEIVHIKHE